MSPHVERAMKIREARERFAPWESGTAWVAPGEGSTWRELSDAFGRPAGSPAWRVVWLQRKDATDRTNLLLTGSPITAYDRQRWESGNVE